MGPPCFPNCAAKLYVEPLSTMKVCCICCVCCVNWIVGYIILFNGSTALARTFGQTYACTPCRPIYLIEPQYIPIYHEIFRLNVWVSCTTLTTITALENINPLILITESHCVYCEAGTEFKYYLRGIHTLRV